MDRAPNTSADRPSESPRIMLAIIIAMIAVGSIAYRVLVSHHLEQTSALFVGVPTLLALIVTFTPRARSLMGIALKGVTLALLMSGILLGEGFICILMAAPLFYAITLLVVWSIQYARRRTKARYPKALYSLIALPLLPLSMEGVDERLSFPRDEAVVASKVVALDPATVELFLGETPRFDLPLPAYLRLGFPTPGSVQGAGLQLGDRRVVHFAGGEGRPGDLILEVRERGEGLVRFAMISDASHIAHWLSWKESNVQWEPAAGGTRVTWTLRYQRRLDPAWYFGPWERYAVGLSAEYLIDSHLSPK